MLKSRECSRELVMLGPDTAIRHRSAGSITGGKAAGLHKQVHAGKWELETGGEGMSSSCSLLGSNSCELNGNRTSYAMD